MKQQTLAMAADTGFEQFRRRTKRDVFLSTMEKVLPWQELCSVVQGEVLQAQVLNVGAGTMKVI
jgi:hypothetical protein